MAHAWFTNVSLFLTVRNFTKKSEHYSTSKNSAWENLIIIYVWLLFTKEIICKGERLISFIFKSFKNDYLVVNITMQVSQAA